MLGNIDSRWRITVASPAARTADIDYRLTPNFHIGASAGFDKSGDFTEGTGLLYARYVFNDPK